MTFSTNVRRRNGRAAVAFLLTAALASPMVSTPVFADEIRANEYWLEDYGVTQAWETTRGEGVTVAVIDSGVDGSHPDLQGVVVGGTDVSGAGGANGQQGVGEVPEHGTLVATLLAGRGHEPVPVAVPPVPAQPSAPAAPSGSAAAPSGSGAAPSESTGPVEPVGPLSQYGRGPAGVVGVAPAAELLTVSLWIGGATSGPNPAGISINDQIPDAVRWAVDNGATVINMSLGSTSTDWPESWDDAFLYAEQNDVVIVAAAGNRAGGLEQVGAPATIPGVLAVGGLDRQGVASRESSSEGISVGIAAPAENLVGGLPGGFYASQWSGTSGAAPLVSGVAALIRSKYPELSAVQVINRIILTARDAGPEGKDTIYGHGILDAAAAVNADITVPEEPLLGSGGVVSMAQYIETYRRGDAAPAPSDIPSAPATTAPDIPEPTVPVAEERAAVSSGLPATIVFGFAGLILLILAGGSYQVVRIRRGAGRAQG